MDVDSETNALKCATFFSRLNKDVEAFVMVELAIANVSLDMKVDITRPVQLNMFDDYTNIRYRYFCVYNNIRTLLANATPMGALPLQNDFVSSFKDYLNESVSFVSIHVDIANDQDMFYVLYFVQALLKTCRNLKAILIPLRILRYTTDKIFEYSKIREMAMIKGVELSFNTSYVETWNKIIFNTGIILHCNSGLNFFGPIQYGPNGEIAKMTVDPKKEIIVMKYIKYN